MKPRFGSSLIARHSSLLLAFLALLLLVGLAAVPGWAQTTESATTTSGGNWTANTAWTCTPALSPCVPNNGTPAGDDYDVGINGGTVLLNSSSSLTTVTIDSLSIGFAGLGVQDARTLTVTGNVTDSGSLSVDSGGGGGGTLSIGGNLTNSGFLSVGYGGSGGSTLGIGGNLTSSNYIQIGNSKANSANTVTVGGMFDNTGSVFMVGGDAAGAQMLVNVNGAAPSVLTGGFDLQGNAGGAVVEYGSGGITQIGDGSTNAGSLTLNGANAVLDSNSTFTNSALTGLATVARNGSLDLDNGAALNLPGNLANNGVLDLDTSGSGGSTLSVGGNVVNQASGYINIGSTGITATATMNVAGTIDNTAGGITLGGLGPSGAPTLLTAAGLSSNGSPTSTLLGIWILHANTASATVEFASTYGGITAIGDGTNSANLTLVGPAAVMEIGNTGTNSALTELTTIASKGWLQLQNGASVTTISGVDLTNRGTVNVDALGAGGSTLTVGGTLTNGSQLQIGSPGMTSASTVNAGDFVNAGGQFYLYGGNQVGAVAELNVSGAVPPTLTGYYYLQGNTGGAVVNFASGGPTQIGGGIGNFGAVVLVGPKAFMEVGATNSNSALAGLTAITAGGELYLQYGATVSVASDLANNGALYVDNSGTGGSTLSVSGTLTNGGYLLVGDGSPSASAVNVSNFVNTASGTVSLFSSTQPGSATALSVAGATTNSGQIHLVSGVMSMSTLTNFGTVSNGSGQLTIGTVIGGQPAGSVTFGADATLTEQIGGTNAAQFGVIDARGPVTLAGTLNVATLSGFSFSQGESFDFMNFPAGDLSGTFGALSYGSFSGSGSNPLDIGNGLALDVNYENNAVVLDVIAGSNTPGTDNWQGRTDVWNGAGNGANWTTGAIPASTDNVTVGTNTAGTVTYNDSNDTILSLTVQQGSTSNYALNLYANDALTVTNAITINPGGEIDVAASGAFLTAASLSNAGTLDVANGGTVSVAVLSNTGAITANSGALALNGASGTYDNASAGTMTLAGTGAVVGVSGSETLTNEGAISGAGVIGNLSLVNSGLITTNGASSGSVLDIVPNASPSAIGITNNAGGTLAAAPGATLDLDLSQPAAGGFTGLDNEGAITVAGDGTLEIADTSAASTALITTNGTITAGDSTNPGTLLLNDGGSGSVFDFQSGTTAGTIALVNNSSIIGSAGDETLVNDVGHTIQGAGSISNLALENYGAIIPQGTLTITPNAGGFVDDGADTVGAGDALAVAGINGNTAIGLTSNGVLTVNGGTWSNSGSVSVAPGSVNGTTGIVQIRNGGAVAAASVTNSGTISTGNAVGDTGGNTLTVSGAFTNNAGGTLQLEVSADAVTAGSFSNAGNVSLASGTSLTVNSGGAYTQTAGTTDVDGTLMAATINLSGGLLQGAGTIQGEVSQTGGTLQPGDAPGVLTIAGDYSLSDSNYSEEIAGGAAGTGYSALDVTDNLNLMASNTLNPLDLLSFTPTDGETFDIINAGSIAGQFTDNSIPFQGGTFTVSYNSAGCSFGSACVELTWNLSASPLSSTSTPEPASLLLLATGLLALAWAARRRTTATAA